MAQPVALAAAVDGNRVFLNGRRGVAVAVDVDNASVIWETTLPGGRGSFVDPVIGGNAVLFFLGEEIVALFRSNGSVLYRLPGATTPPLVVGNRLYYGTTGGVLRVADSAGGRTVSNLRLPGTASTAPVAVGDRLAVGLENGRMVVVHPAGIR
jgi:outer membrane protein assembly factor BamB